MNPTESSVRELLREDAAHAPVMGDLGARVVTRARRQRRRRVGAASVAALLAVSSWAVSSQVSHGTDIPAAAAGSIAVPTSAMRDCQPPSSAADIARLPFAFDGTVTAIGRTSGAGTIGPEYAPVTFAVTEWFHGGSDPVTTVRMEALLAPGEVYGEAGPTYEVGTRLLVSGTPGAAGALWAQGCGYTRFYDPTTATYWRSATR